MISFKGFEVVPAAGMFSTGVKQIRMSVSAKKVGLSERLLDALNHPSFISFHRGVGENEGKMIIAATEKNGDTGEIQLDPGRKYASFYNCEFVRMCDEMIQKFANGSFKRGTYFSIIGVEMEERGAVVFDFRNAEEHCVKVGRGNAATHRSGTGFPAPQRVYNMQDMIRTQG